MGGGGWGGAGGGRGLQEDLGEDGDDLFAGEGEYRPGTHRARSPGRRHRPGQRRSARRAPARGHVLGGADDDSGLREGATGTEQPSGDAEVEDLDAADITTRQVEVAGLEVAVHDLLGVRALECGGDGAD